MAQDKEILKPLVPTPEEMLTKLHSIDTELLNLIEAENLLRGKLVWINILTAPVAMVLLALFTLFGYMVIGYLIPSFIVSALLIFMVSKAFDNYDREIKLNARREIEGRIKDIEDEFGFIIHFEMFLPTRYRHLVQTLKRRKYYYIEQYIQAINLLQNKLDAEKFTEAWHRVYPETKPVEEELGSAAEETPEAEAQEMPETKEVVEI